jgi:hypothetical protein
MKRAIFATLIIMLLAPFSTASYSAGSPIQLTPELEARFKAGLKDPHIQFLRSVITQCLKTNYVGDNCTSFANGKINAKDLSGKFIIYWTDPQVITGGFGISIIFLKHPDKLFNSIIFGSSEPFRLHDFYPANLNSGQIKQIQQDLGPILSRDDLAI